MPETSGVDPSVAEPALSSLAASEAGRQAQWQPVPTGTVPPHNANRVCRSHYWAGGVYADAPLHAVNAGLSNVGCAVMGLLGVAFVLALAAQIVCWVMQFRFP